MKGDERGLCSDDGGGCENVRNGFSNRKSTQLLYTHLPFYLRRGTSTSTLLQAQFLISPRGTFPTLSSFLFPTIHHSTSYSLLHLSTPSDALGMALEDAILRAISPSQKASNCKITVLY